MIKLMFTEPPGGIFILDYKFELDEILENMSDGLLTLDSNWIITAANAQFEIVIKMKREDVIGKNFMELFFSAPEHKDTLYVKNYTQAMVERKPAYFIDYYKPLEIWTAVHVYPKANGGIAIFFREISEERRAAQELKDAIIARDTFMGIASHELNTPLTSIKLQIQIIERMLNKKGFEVITEERLRQMLQGFHSQTNRLSRLVDDMLDVSRIETGELQIKRSITDVSGMVDLILKRYQSEVTEDIHFNAFIEPEVVANVDIFRIEQVMVNLFSNAIKYAPGKIDIHLKKGKGKFHFAVKDYGHGISIENQSKLFQKFERIESRKDVTGLGLGLFISKQIVNAHQGEMKIHSEKGKGAEFSISIPIV